jgi:hypothetical protein
MKIKITGEKELLEAFSKKLESKLGFELIEEEMYFWDNNLQVQTDNLKCWIGFYAFCPNKIYNLPEEWDKAFELIEQLVGSEPYFNTKIVSDRIKHLRALEKELISQAKEKGYKGGMWIWDGGLNQIKKNIMYNTPISPSANPMENIMPDRFSFKDNKLYLNDTCIYDNGEWKLLLVPGKIYVSNADNGNWIVFRFNQVVNGRVYAFESCGSDIGYVNNFMDLDRGVFFVDEQDHFMEKASTYKQSLLDGAREEAGYKWNGEELERIKPKLELFGYDVKINVGAAMVKVGCVTKDIVTYKAIESLTKKLTKDEALLIRGNGMITYQDENTDSVGFRKDYITKDDHVDKIKDIIKEYKRQANA